MRAAKFKQGDLLWLPQAATMYKGKESPMAVKLNSEPEIAIYVEQAEYDDLILVLVEGEKWIVEDKHVRIMKEEECWSS